jgi:4-carboxymuconolactone decarboxylase
MLPQDVYPDSRSRLPLLERAALDEPGQTLYDTVVGPESRTLLGLRGPSGIWLHSPRLGAHQRAANQYLRYEADLEPRLRELAILVTAREIDNQFEWTAHEPAAQKEGLDPAIIDLVKHRRPLGGLGEREALIITFGREVFREKKVSSRTFARAVQAFGWQGVVDLAALMGNYAMTAVLLNAVDQQLPPGQDPLLPIP